MQKTKALRILPVIASICVVLNIILNICVFLKPTAIAGLFTPEYNNINPETCPVANSFLIASYLTIIPFGAVCIAGVVSKTLKRTKGVISLVLAVSLYCISEILARVFSIFALRESTRYGLDTSIHIKILTSVEELFSSLKLAVWC